MHLSENAPSPFKRKPSQKINLVRKINNLNDLCATPRDRNLVDHFRFSVPIDLITKSNFGFIQKITPFPCCCFSHRFSVNKLHHVWLRDRLCRPTKNPQSSASNYKYFSVLCIQIYGFICLITAGAFSLLCVLVPFRS